eukprot:2470875-Pleurochrysis_carterae.AAC.3
MSDREALLHLALKCARHGRTADVVACFDQLASFHATWRCSLGNFKHVNAETTVEALLKRARWLEAAGLVDEAHGSFIQAAAAMEQAVLSCAMLVPVKNSDSNACVEVAVRLRGGRRGACKAIAATTQAVEENGMTAQLAMQQLQARVDPKHSLGSCRCGHLSVVLK